MSCYLLCTRKYKKILETDDIVLHNTALMILWHPGYFSWRKESGNIGERKPFTSMPWLLLRNESTSGADALVLCTVYYYTHIHELSKIP